MLKGSIAAPASFWSMVTSSSSYRSVSPRSSSRVSPESPARPSSVLTPEAPADAASEELPGAGLPRAGASAGGLEKPLMPRPRPAT